MLYICSFCCCPLALPPLKTSSPSSLILGTGIAMERQSGYGNPLDLMSLNFCGNVNDVAYGAAADYTDHFIAAVGGSESQSDGLHLSPYFHSPRTPNYFKFLAENSTFLEKASPSDVLERIPSLAGTNFGEVVPRIQEELGTACGSKLAEFFPDMDACEVKPFTCVLNSSSHEASLNVGCLNSYNEREVAKQLKSLQHQSHAQNHTPWAEEPRGTIGNASRSNPKVSVAASVFLSKPRGTASRQRAATSDRKRRLRIAEELNAFQELLPHTVKGSQATVIDDIIDHIKYLQLRMKELSQRRLGGGSTYGPFVFLEGYGHYIVHEHMNEPLEEIMGKLLEQNPSAAIKLMESRGLFVMPMALA